MMSNDSIIIKGGKKLEGEVRISGSKNATVALIPAAVLASNVVTICDVPDISDVAALTTLLEEPLTLILPTIEPPLITGLSFI
jgi:UDP-N-acetylglucosamine 1-carboxyvinyltransferase